MSPELLRQRRNLLLVSVILILVQIAGISVEKISVLGTTLKIQNMGILMLSIWVVWFYQLLRYYQYLKSEEGLNIRVDVSNEIYKRISSHLKALEKHEDYDPSRPSYRVDHKGFLTWWYGELRADEPVRIASKWYVLYANISALVHICVNTPLVTDYLLPIIIGACPLIILLIQNA